MRQIYSTIAVDSYRKVAAEFDCAATKFSTAAGKCDPGADGASVVGLPDATRTAWMDAARHAAALDRLTPVLHAAAQLAGAPATARRDQGGKDAALLPLVCDPGTAHRRRVWEAWTAQGRTGRWGPLLALGVTIRALPELDGFQTYRTPAPMQTRTISTGRGMSTEATFDPEDPDYQEPEPVKPRIRQLAP
jgi:hypothetical protein